MSKTKKIATAAVSIVMAGTMALSLVACDNDRSSSSNINGLGYSDYVDYMNEAWEQLSEYYTAYTSSSGVSGLTQSQELLSVSTDDNDEYKLSYGDNVTLNMNVGYQNTTPYGYISYQTYDSLVTGEFTLFGTTYSAGSLKPAWSALSTKLGITFNDSFQNRSSDNQISQALTDGALASYDVITGSASQIVTQANADSDLFLDLSLYLDYMPNYKAFLEENPIVMLSLTSNTDTGAMYYAPYFDGNDDIEKYEIANMTWIENLLDGTDDGDSTTFTEQATAKQSNATGATSVSRRGDVLDGTSASATSYMGTTGSWWVTTTDVSAADLDEDGNPKDGVDTSATTTVVVNYDDALDAAKDSSSELYAALDAVTGVDAAEIATLESGNIVDLQNLAINESAGEVTGAQLLAILRAYIDVAYQTESGSKFYDVRSDVFNGYNAAWDVDLLVALSRCVVTNQSLLGTETAVADIYAISGRQGTTQRYNDLLSLVGELYGERGLTFRYEYAYIDSDNTIKDARLEESTYEALDRMNELVEEGLVYTGTSTGNGTISYYTSGEIEALMIWDYVQTQTANGGYAAMGITSVSGVDSDYNFAPIVTPVSRYSDGTTSDAGYDYTDDGEKIMRFTESWRSVKNTGFAIPYDAVKNNPEKLAAVLAFIDYLFSNDGQILMTYGPISSNNDLTENSDGTYSSEADGFWYGDEAEGVSLTTVGETYDGVQYTIKDEYAGQYFIYDNKVYTGTYYNGEMQPTMTDANLQFYYGSTVNNLTLGSSPIGSNYALSYTNYARAIIGSALPIGNKLQSFEYQCTADCGIIGADKVAACLNNGTIEHVYQQITDNPWYTIIPTTLPYDAVTSSLISDTWTPYNSTWFASSSSTYINWLLEIMFRGLDGETSSSTYFGTSGGTLPSSAAEAVRYIQ